MTTTDELRSKLGRVGIWMGPPAVVGLEPGAAAQAIERAGFTSVWVGGGNRGPEDFKVLRELLSGSERLVVAPGIASIWAWPPSAIRAEAEQLEADFPGRFILGLGVSHAPLVAQLGHTYDKPRTKMEKFLDELDHPAGHASDRGNGELPPIVLAALGQKMLRLSARYAGAHTYFTTPAHTADARPILGREPLLVPEQAVSLDPAAAGGVRAYAARYLQLPNYTRMLKNYGFTDADIAGGGSDRLVNSVIPSGAAAAVSAIRAHLDGGADHVVVQPLGASGAFDIAQLRELADITGDLRLSAALHGAVAPAASDEPTPWPMAPRGPAPGGRRHGAVSSVGHGASRAEQPAVLDDLVAVGRAARLTGRGRKEREARAAAAPRRTRCA